MLWLLIACAKSPPPPGVLVVTVDTWRADHLTPIATPNAVALAERGARYDNAWSPVGLTTPAHASLWTGLLPPAHGMRGNNHHGFTLDASHTTTAEALSAAGWATAAFVSAYPAGPEGGMDQGWQSFSGPEEGEQSGQIAVTRALRWIEEQEGPWLAWVHVYEPHGPYTPDAQDLAAVGGGTDDAARYAGEVHRADRLIGPLLDDAMDRNAWVVLTSDHGEVHDEETCGWQHARSASPMVLRVPLVLAGPGIPVEVRDDLVGLTDVHATVLRLAGLSTTGGLQDVSTRREWVAESGYCDPACALNCAPEGVLGKDRVVFGADTGVWTQRPGWGGWGDPRLESALADYPAPTDAGQVDAERAEALGYQVPSGE
jgi:arylsulfatase A-like enzyme